MSHEGDGVFWSFCLFVFVFENLGTFPGTILNFFLPCCSEGQVFCLRHEEQSGLSFHEEYRLLVPHSSSFNTHLTLSICFGLSPIRDLYKRARLNSLPTFIKCFNAFFELAAEAVLLSLFDCNNQNSFSALGPRAYIGRICVEMRGRGILSYLVVAVVC